MVRLKNGADGSSVLETALVLPVLLLAIMTALEFGRAYSNTLEVASAAESGAEYGAQNPTDTAGMLSAAKLETSDLTGVTFAAAYGCQCSDGSSPSVNCQTVPTCAYNVVGYVQMQATLPYQPLLPYPGIPASLNFVREVRMRVAH